MATPTSPAQSLPEEAGLGGRGGGGRGVTRQRTGHVVDKEAEAASEKNAGGLRVWQRYILLCVNLYI